MKKFKNIRKVGALALTFAILMTLFCVVPISAKRESVELPKAPYLDGEHYYWISWYFDNGYLTENDIVRVYTTEDNYDSSGYGGVWINFDEYAKDIQTEEDENGNYNDVEVEYWNGMGGAYLIPCDFTVKASELSTALSNQINYNEADTCDFFDFEGCYSIGAYKMVVIRDTPDSIGSLVGEMFGGFGDTVNGLANGIKGMFSSLLWQDGTSDSGLSHFAIFGFVIGGLSLALGLGYVIIRKIRG